MDAETERLEIVGLTTESSVSVPILMTTLPFGFVMLA